MEIFVLAITYDGMAVTGVIPSGNTLPGSVIKLLINADLPLLNPPPMAIERLANVCGKATNCSNRFSRVCNRCTAVTSSASEDSLLAKAMKSSLKTFLNSSNASFSLGLASSSPETKSYFCCKAAKSAWVRLYFCCKASKSAFIRSFSANNTSSLLVKSLRTKLIRCSGRRFTRAPRSFPTRP